MNNNTLTNKTCSGCKKKLLLKYFSIKKDGSIYKTCMNCIIKKKNNKCEHGRRKYRCRYCGGVGICEHNRRKESCRDCGGVGICKHGRCKYRCRYCNEDPLKILINNMYSSSKQSDKKYNRYDADHFIDKLFLKELITDYKEDYNFKCSYCKIKMQIINYDKTLCTIERINNSIGHIKSNVILCCLSCNNTKVGQK